MVILYCPVAAEVIAAVTCFTTGEVVLSVHALMVKRMFHPVIFTATQSARTVQSMISVSHRVRFVSCEDIEGNYESRS